MQTKNVHYMRRFYLLILFVVNIVTAAFSNEQIVIEKSDKNIAIGNNVEFHLDETNNKTIFF